MRYESVTRPALLGLLALAACRQSTPSAGLASPAASTNATPPLSASPAGTPEAPGHSAAPGPASGLQGAVTAGPSCPVERVDSPCPPRPLSAEVNAEDASGHVAAMTRSGSDGRYRLTLPAGTYTLSVAVSGPLPRCPTPTATVVAGKVATVDISCDTGIR